MDSHVDRGLLWLGQSRHDLAEREFRGALATDPNDPTAHAFLALCLIERDQYDEAAHEAREAIRLEPEYAFAYYALANALFLRDRLKDAETALETASQLDPESPMYLGLLAQIRLQQRRWRDALDAAERGLALDPEHGACNNLRAMALVQLGRRAEAGLTIGATLARNPEDALTHANQGWAFLHQGEPEKALHHFQEALRLEPDLEWARMGVVEALKAKNPIYRVMLRYFLWMSRLSTKMQWVVVLGLIFGRGVLVRISEQAPLLRPFVDPILIALFGFFILTWVADPLFNSILRFNRYGRLALSREQVMASNWLLVYLLGTLVPIVLFVLSRDSGHLGLAEDFFWLLLPVGGAFKCPAGWPRRTMLCLTLLLTVAGPGMYVLWGVTPPVPEKLVLRSIYGYFLPGVILSTWLCMFLSQARTRR